MSWNLECPGHPYAKGLVRLISFIFEVFALALTGASCGEGYSFASNCERLSDGQEGRASVAFKMNGSSVKLELLLHVCEGSAIVELDHPDGRTTESLEISGPCLRELRKEFAKEPGSWGLRVSAKGGSILYWAALHDRKKYQGPDDRDRFLVER